MIRFLLLLYPKAWRKEYGEEFAEILASRQLTLRVVADVLASAAWQRLRYAPLWMWVGVCLMVTNVGGMFLGFAGLVPWKRLRWLGPIESLPLFLTAFWIASRKGRSFVSGALGTMKAMLIGASPGLAVSFLAVALVHPSPVDPLRLHLWRWGSQWIDNICGVALLGLSGALCGTLIRRFQRRRA